MAGHGGVPAQKSRVLKGSSGGGGNVAGAPNDGAEFTLEGGTREVAAGCVWERKGRASERAGARAEEGRRGKRKRGAAPGVVRWEQKLRRGDGRPARTKRRSAQSNAGMHNRREHRTGAGAAVTGQAGDEVYHQQGQAGTGGTGAAYKQALGAA